jgi:hypothetical protein
MNRSAQALTLQAHPRLQICRAARDHTMMILIGYDRSADAQAAMARNGALGLVGAYNDGQADRTSEQAAHDTHTGRRWYQLRPEPRRRVDFIGFNYTWWLILWIFLIFIIFLPWGRGWGY